MEFQLRRNYFRGLRSWRIGFDGLGGWLVATDCAARKFEEFLEFHHLNHSTNNIRIGLILPCSSSNTSSPCDPRETWAARDDKCTPCQSSLLPCTLSDIQSVRKLNVPSKIIQVEFHTYEVTGPRRRWRKCPRPPQSHQQLPHQVAIPS